MLNNRVGTRRGVAALCVTAIASMTLAACAEDGAIEGGAESVPSGASKADYAAALEDMDAVEIDFQMATGPGVPTTIPAERWAEAVNEWSDGKIKINVLYSSSRVSVAEMGVAMQDGLVDGGYLLPYTEPDLFPIATYNGDLTSTQDSEPFIGELEMFGQWLEFGNTQEALLDEARAAGVEPLLWYLPGHGSGTFCRDAVTTASDLDGRTVRTNTQIMNDIYRGMGAATVDIPTLELFTALERGTIDCAATAMSVASSLGLEEVTSDWVLDDEVQPPAPLGGIGFSKSKWDSLPLAARQLLWDRLDVYIDASLREREFGVMVDALSKAADANVTIHSWDESAREKHQDVIDAAFDGAAENAPSGIDGEKFVSEIEANAEKWAGIVEELGYDQESSWQTFADWWTKNKDSIDLQPYIDRVVDEVLTQHRPE